MTNLTDEDCQDVIQELDNLDQELKDWDMKFVESNLDRERFSDRQKKEIERMIEEYGI